MYKHMGACVANLKQKICNVKETYGHFGSLDDEVLNLNTNIHTSY